MVDEDAGTPIYELHSYIHSRGMGLEMKTLHLLKQARAYKIEVWWRHREIIDDFSKEYNTLYDDYVGYSKYVSGYVRMCADPWSRDEENNVERKDVNTLSTLNISSTSLMEQRDWLKMLFTDISNQINNLNHDLNNALINWLAGFSLFVAFVSLVVSLVALVK